MKINNFWLKKVPYQKLGVTKKNEQTFWLKKSALSEDLFVLRFYSTVNPMWSCRVWFSEAGCKENWYHKASDKILFSTKKFYFSLLLSEVRCKEKLILFSWKKKKLCDITKRCKPTMGKGQHLQWNLCKTATFEIAFSGWCGKVVVL